MKQKITFLVFSVFSVLRANAQCAMCRAVLESEESQSAAEGINDGIVFLMAIPYILVATIAYFVYRTYNKSQKSEKN
jgi:heme/copper-type cytochrome/quinol oxidase subunit 2